MFTGLGFSDQKYYFLFNRSLTIVSFFAFFRLGDHLIQDFDPEKGNYQEVSMAGRIMGRRVMGKASFLELMASTEITMRVVESSIFTNQMRIEGL